LPKAKWGQRNRRIGFTPASEVKVTKADGTVEVAPPLKRREFQAVVAEGERVARRKKYANAKGLRRSAPRREGRA
jgi:hypothetical protein